MQPNPGLTIAINRYLRNLDAILPRRSRKGDHGAQLLDRAFRDIADVSPGAADAIRSFLHACERFRQQQFWVDEDHENRETGVCWLPLLILGKNWRDVVRTVLRVDLPETFTHVRQILLRPASPKAVAIVKFTLFRNITGVTEAGYDRFVVMAKKRFDDIECVYDPDMLDLEILRGRTIEVSFDDHNSPDYPGEGSCAPWMEALFELKAVESVEMTFARRPNRVPMLGDCVSTALILPACPVEWRKSLPPGEGSVLHLIEDRLGIGRMAPFHTILTAIEPEWFSLIEAGMASALSPDSTAISDRPQDPAATEDFVLRHLARRFTFPPGIELQEGTEYESLAVAFVRNNGAEGSMVTHPLLVCPHMEIGFRLIDRLSDVRYVSTWAGYFAALAGSTADRITDAVNTNQQVPSPIKKVPAEFLLRVSGSHTDIARFILRSLSNCLEMLMRIEGEVAANLARTQAFHRLLYTDNSENESSFERDALHQLLRTTIYDKREEVRCSALSAIIYFLRSDDVIADVEAHGDVDDKLVISGLIGSDELKTIIAPELAAWAASTQGHADQLIARPLQKHVYAEFAEMTKRLSEIIGGGH